MNIDTTLHLSEVIVLIAGLIAVLRYLHTFDKNIAVRHAENSMQLKTIDDGLCSVRLEVKEVRESFTEGMDQIHSMKTDIAVLKARH